MSTLYVCDLDGTLLTPKAQLSPRTVTILNRLLDRGLLFTVATARTPATANGILAPLHLRLPAVFLTGALVYDLRRMQTMKTVSFPPDTARCVCEAFQILRKEALLYTFCDNQLIVYYRELTGSFEQKFVKERMDQPYKKFVQTQDYVRSTENGALMMALLCLDDERDAREWYRALSVIPGVSCYLNPNEYHQGFTVEAFPSGCDKGCQIETLKAYAGASRTVAFGDNFNDISLFEACDESCAVENAVGFVKERATRVIGSNCEDGVALWLEQHAEIP